jgi:acetolactate synthase-1/2/3 large subunit
MGASPGTEWAPVWEAMANQIEEGKNGPRLLDCWHETLAVDIAAGYTLATGRMQGVLLHAGSGLLQGAMGIHAAWVASVPMVVISGETTTYGEQPGFDPGAQWINNLSIPGSTTRLVEPVCKFASHSGGRYTVYESVIRSGEMAQRNPPGPTYLSVTTETLMEEWTPPANGGRTVPRISRSSLHRSHGPRTRWSIRKAPDVSRKRSRRLSPYAKSWLFPLSKSRVPALPISRRTIHFIRVII